MAAMTSRAIAIVPGRNAAPGLSAAPGSSMPSRTWTIALRDLMNKHAALARLPGFFFAVENWYKTVAWSPRPVTTRVPVTVVVDPW